VVTVIAIVSTRVYASFSDIPKFIHGLRAKGLPSGEASRCNQFLSKMVVSFESVKHIYQYRTPRTKRVGGVSHCRISAQAPGNVAKETWERRAGWFA